MARDRDEDEDDRPRRRRDDDEPEERVSPQTTNPGSAKAAAILWIIVGALGLVGGLLSLANANLQTVVQILVALAFLITGIQTLSGSVSGILGAGIASIILATIGLIAGLAVVVFGGAVAAGGAGGAGGGAAGAGGLVMLVGILMLIGPTMLMIAGILACVGNKKYKLWRAYKKGASRGGSRSRGRDYDDEDEDDRPRKRRRDDD